MTQRRPLWPGLFAAAMGCLWLGLFPLWQGFTYANITRVKWLGALWFGAISGAGMLLVAVILLLRRELRPTLNPVRLLALAYFLWIALSAWRGSLADTLNAQKQLAVLWGARRYEGLVTQLCYGVIFLAASQFRPKTKPILAACALALTVFCLITALQYAGQNPLGLYPAGRSIFTNYEFQGTIGNIDMVSGYLALVVPLLLCSFLQRRSGGWYLLAAGSLGVMLECCMEVQSGLIAMGMLALLLTLWMFCQPTLRFRGMVILACMGLTLALRSMLILPWLDGGDAVRLTFPFRAAVWLALSLLVLSTAAALRRTPGQGFSLRTVVCAALALAVAAVGCIALLPVPEGTAGLWELHETLLGRGQDSFGSWRLGVWRHTLLMSRDNLLFGTGPDTFLYAMHAHLTEAGAVLGETFDNPHNEYLAILSNNGLPALALYLALLGTVIVRCFRRKTRGAWQMALGCAIVCYAVQGFFSFSICLVAPMFWAVLGMAARGAFNPSGLPDQGA